MNFSMRQKCLGLFWAILTSIIVSSCARAQDSTKGQDYSGYDLSTIERVNAAREAKLGKQLDKESKGCVMIPKELPDIILLGSFAYDRGCTLSGAIIKKREVSVEKDFSGMALESLGWKNSSAEKQKELAMRWVRYGLLAFENPLTQPTEDFTKQSFQMPQAVSNQDGSITVSLWVQRPSGMLCERGYDKFDFKFQADGALSAKTNERGFSVPCRQPGQ